MTHGDLVDLYLRLSVDREGKDALERQEADLRAWAAREGKTVRKVWSDNASGFKDVTREDFDNAVKAVASGEVGTLAVWKLDRLSRRGAGQVGLVLDSVERVGGRLFFLQDSLDSTIPGHRTVIVVVSEQARSESMNTSLRVRNKIAGDNSKGLPKRGIRPFGWHVDGITIREDEADLIRSAVRAILDDGGSMVQIAHLWNAMGVQTDGMKRDRKGRDGVVRPARGYWTTTTVRQLLLRERNAGVLIAHGAELPNSQIQPIITRADMEALQARIKAGTPLGRRATTLLGGILRCECGAPMHGTTSYSQRKGGPRNVYTIYKCSETAFDKTRRHAAIQQAIADKHVQHEALVFLAAGYVEAPSNAAASRDRLREVERQLAGLDDQEANAEEALIMGLGKKARVLGQLERIRSERIALQDERDRLQGSSSAENLLVGFGMAFNALYDLGLPEEATQATMQRGFNYWADLGTEKQQAILRAYFMLTVKVGGRGASRITVAVRDEAASEGYRNYLIGRELSK